jgi:hypothetical protein
MKNFIKMLLVNLIFTVKERTVILKSLNYSELKYQRHGRYDDALSVGIVKFHLKKFFRVGKPCKKKEEKCECMSQNQVEIDVRKLIQRTAAITGAYVLNKFREYVDECEDTPTQHEDKKPEIEVYEIDGDECVRCEKRDKCFIYNVVRKKILELEAERQKEQEEKKEVPETEKTHNAEYVQEATQELETKEE